MPSDRKILLDAFKTAVTAWSHDKTYNALLSYGPRDEIMAPVVQALERASAYKAAKGQSLFTGNSGVVITATTLAPLMFNKAGWLPSEEPDDVVDWVRKLLRTHEAPGWFIAAISGLRIDRAVSIGEGWKLACLIRRCGAK
jgi:hypothetical protein